MDVAGLVLLLPREKLEPDYGLESRADFRKIRFEENLIVLRVMKKQLGNTVILHCPGRMVRGHETAILCAASQGGHGS